MCTSRILSRCNLGYDRRHAQLLSWIARRWFGVCCAAYVDDVDTCEPSYSGSSGKKVLHDIARLAGTPFAPEKDKDFATANTFLGVLADLSDFVAGSVALKPKPGRVRKIVAALQSVLSSDRLSSGPTATICGKCEYTTSSGACVRVGRARWRPSTPGSIVMVAEMTASHSHRDW